MMALAVSRSYCKYRNNIELHLFTFSCYNFFSADLDFYPTMVYSFIVTYAFMGLELVCIEMDDPFGNDANDLNVASLVEKVLKDITMCIEDVDGDEKADLLKKYVTIMDTLEKSEENIRRPGKVNKAMFNCIFTTDRNFDENTDVRTCHSKDITGLFPKSNIGVCESLILISF